MSTIVGRRELRWRSGDGDALELTHCGRVVATVRPHRHWPAMWTIDGCRGFWNLSRAKDNAARLALGDINPGASRNPVPAASHALNRVEGPPLAADPGNAPVAAPPAEDAGVS